jgi:hypothetical protein
VCELREEKCEKFMMKTRKKLSMINRQRIIEKFYNSSVTLLESCKITPYQKNATMKFTWCNLGKRTKNVNGLRTKEDNWFLNLKQLLSSVELSFIGGMQFSVKKLQVLTLIDRKTP